MLLRRSLALIKAAGSKNPCQSLSTAMASKVMKVVGFNEVRDGLGNNTMLVVDVRNDHERKDPGRIPGTVNVPCNVMTFSVRYSIHLKRPFYAISLHCAGQY